VFCIYSEQAKGQKAEAKMPENAYSRSGPGSERQGLIEPQGTFSNSHRARDGQGELGRGVPRPVRRGGWDDSEEAGGEELETARERAGVFHARFGEVDGMIQKRLEEGSCWE
jgi:hypothetical protein